MQSVYDNYKTADTTEDYTEQDVTGSRQGAKIPENMQGQETNPSSHSIYLTPKALRTALFFFLPKIHKRNNPGRPIISANECPTERISEFVEFYIRPLAKQGPYYVKDTGHFLDILHEIGIVHPDTILCTIDVLALYTSIPHEEGITAMRRALSTRLSTTLTLGYYAT